MTTTTTSPVGSSSTRPMATDPLRRILGIDAGFCLVAGATLLATAAPVADHAGLAAPTVVRVIGAFLVLLGIDLAVLARSPRRWARLGAAVTGIGDVAWTVGSLAIAATAGLPAWAAAAVVAQAVATLAIGATKAIALQASR